MNRLACLVGLSALALVGCNDEPLPPGIGLTPEAPTTLDDLVLSITEDAVDPNKNDEVVLGISWVVDGAPQADLDGEYTVPAARTRRDETWEVTIIPRDDKLDGQSVSASVTIANTAPVVDTITISPEVPRTEDTLSLTVEMSDVDEDAVTATYLWSVNGTAVGNEETLASSTFGKGDSVVVEVVPNDGTVDGEAVTGGPILIGNTAPSITGASIAPVPATVAEVLECVSEGWFDIDGDEEQGLVEWSVNGTVVASTATLGGDFFAKGDSVTCTLTPFDGDDEGAPVTSGALLISNALPALESVTIDQGAPVEGDTLTASLGTSTDADGDAISFSYAWYVDGVEVATTETLSSDFFDRDNEVYVAVTPNDGEADGPTVQSGVVIVQNSAPSLTSVTLSPGSGVKTNDTLTASWVGTDADGDEIIASYAWTVNGTSIAATGATLDGATWFDKDDSVNVNITLLDDVDASATVSGTAVIIENSLPTGLVAEIDPAQPQVEDDLICESTGTVVDADGDRLTYSAEWTLDGSSFSGTTDTTVFTDDTVESTETDSGDEWSCTITVDDGDGTVTATSNTVLVSNNVSFRYGYYWVKATYAAPRADHSKVCATHGLTATAATVTLTWDSAKLSQLSSDFGFTSAGDSSCCAQSMWCFEGTGSSTGTAAGQCETHNFGSTYNNYGRYGSSAGVRPVFTCTK